jgi:hypothetical protein
VRGFDTLKGLDFITALPFQDDPTTLEIEPVTPPKMPCLIFAITNNYLVETMPLTLLSAERLSTFFFPKM